MPCRGGIYERKGSVGGPGGGLEPRLVEATGERRPPSGGAPRFWRPKKAENGEFRRGVGPKPKAEARDGGQSPPLTKRREKGPQGALFATFAGSDKPTGARQLGEERREKGLLEARSRAGTWRRELGEGERKGKSYREHAAEQTGAQGAPAAAKSGTRWREAPPGASEASGGPEARQRRAGGFWEGPGGSFGVSGEEQHAEACAALPGGSTRRGGARGACVCGF